MIDLRSEGTGCCSEDSTPATPVPRQLYDSTHTLCPTSFVTIGRQTVPGLSTVELPAVVGSTTT